MIYNWNRRSRSIRSFERCSFGYNTSAETIPDLRNIAFRCGPVRVVRGKKPGYSLLCASETGKLSEGQLLRIMRLRAGLTIRKVAETVGTCRHTLMNYESGRTKEKMKS